MFLFDSLLKKVGLIAALILVTTLGFQIRGCIKAKEELRQYHWADEVRKQDKRTDKYVDEQKKSVDEMVTPDDLRDGFRRLREHGADK